MNSPLLVTAAIAVRDGCVLLVKNVKLNDKWSLPGGVGGWKFSADPAIAVQHEVRGDVGAEFVGKFFDYRFREGELPIITLFFAGYVTGEIKPCCKNIIDAKFFTIEKALKMKLAYEHSRALWEFVDHEWCKAR